MLKVLDLLNSRIDSKTIMFIAYAYKALLGNKSSVHYWKDLLFFHEKKNLWHRFDVTYNFLLFFRLDFGKKIEKKHELQYFLSTPIRWKQMGWSLLEGGKRPRLLPRPLNCTLFVPVEASMLDWIFTVVFYVAKLIYIPIFLNRNWILIRVSKTFLKNRMMYDSSRWCMSVYLERCATVRLKRSAINHCTT